MRSEAEKLSGEWVEHQQKLSSLNSAHRLAKAGFQLEPKEFGLPDSATQVGAQEVAAEVALQEVTLGQSQRLEKIQPFIAALGQRVALALELTAALPSDSPSAPSADAESLPPLLAAVGAEMARVHDISSKLNAYLALAQNRGNHSNPAQVEGALTEFANEMQTATQEIQARLGRFQYPFPHARGHLTVGEYARHESPAENLWQRAYVDANTIVDRLFALHYRLVGRVLAMSAVAERTLDKE